MAIAVEFNSPKTSNEKCLQAELHTVSTPLVSQGRSLRCEDAIITLKVNDGTAATYNSVAVGAEAS
eukprot:scaffold38987_cov20-Prasinocladus_malaysianus.AAC.2